MHALRPFALVVAAWMSHAWASDASEMDTALRHLRAGEKARLEKALGPATFHPLYRVALDL